MHGLEPSTEVVCPGYLRSRSVVRFVHSRVFQMRAARIVMKLCACANDVGIVDRRGDRNRARSAREDVRESVCDRL